MSADAESRSFLDTNVLVYAFDRDAPAPKRERARALLLAAVRDEDAVISPQVIGEFVVTVTRKLAEPMDPAAAREVAAQLAELPSVDIDAKLCLRAMDTAARYRIAYWDGLIIAAAERAGCHRVWSEDLAAGQRYHALVVEDPFAEDGRAE